MTEETLRETPLAREHEALGARIVPFAGWRMPVQYKGGLVKEHLAVRTGAGLFDVCHMGELWLRGARIAPYPKASPKQANRAPDAERKLLLNKSEINKLIGALSQKGLTIIPLSVYSSRRLVKIKLALAKGKRKFDKREAIKEKEYKRRLNSRVR